MRLRACRIHSSQSGAACFAPWQHATILSFEAKNAARRQSAIRTSPLWIMVWTCIAGGLWLKAILVARLALVLPSLSIYPNPNVLALQPDALLHQPAFSCKCYIVRKTPYQSVRIGDAFKLYISPRLYISVPKKCATSVPPSPKGMIKGEIKACGSRCLV